MPLEYDNDYLRPLEYSGCSSCELDILYYSRHLLIRLESLTSNLTGAFSPGQIEFSRAASTLLSTSKRVSIPVACDIYLAVKYPGMRARVQLPKQNHSITSRSILDYPTHFDDWNGQHDLRL